MSESEHEFIIRRVALEQILAGLARLEQRSESAADETVSRILKEVYLFLDSVQRSL